MIKKIALVVAAFLLVRYIMQRNVGASKSRAQWVDPEAGIWA